jgi:hypothetical protein
MDGILGLIISLISGAVGGNIAGGVLKEQSLAPLATRLRGSWVAASAVRS